VAKKVVMEAARAAMAAERKGEETKEEKK
jgi:hypothetical protein